MSIRPEQKGFTLVEIVITIVIIGILASLGIPSLVRARINANENSAKLDLKTISTAAESFRAASPVPQYPATLTILSTANPSYLDATFVNSVVRHGYIFNLAGDEAGFGATAVPETANMTGVASYCVDHTGVMRIQAPGGAYAAVVAGCGAGNPPVP